ncbi:hypothetical protein Tco_0004206 [Tanacetum coccineum]
MIIGLGQEMRSCTKSSDDDDFLHNKDKPLVLSWGRTPRLDSGVRVSEILGFPSISLISISGPKWAPCLARVRSNRVRADVSSLPWMFLGPRKAQRPGKPIIRHQVLPV